MKINNRFLIAFFFLTLIGSKINFGQYMQNYAFEFKSSSQSYIAIPNHTELNPTSTITLEAWVYPKSFTNYPTIIGKNYSSNYWFGFNTNGVLRFYPKGGGGGFSVDGNLKLTLNKWQHVAATYDGSSTKLYIDGLLDITSSAFSGSITPNTDSLFIGVDRNGTVKNYFFEGYIDNVRLWNVARTQEQIRSHMYIPLQIKNPTGNYAGLVGSWLMDWNGTDWSGSVNNNGILRNVNYVYLENKPVNHYDFNNALSLDGNSYMAAPNENDFNATTAITIEAWIKRNLSAPQAGSQCILGKAGAGRIDYSLNFQTSTTDFYFYINPPTNVYAANWKSNINDEAWHHVAVTYSSTNGQVNMYLDGKPLYSTIFSAKPTIPNNPDSLYVGGAGNGQLALQFFSGHIDEVRIWKNVVRTEDQIKATMFSSRKDTDGASESCAFSFDNFTNYMIGNSSGIGNGFSFRRNATITSPKLQNTHSAPIISTVAYNSLTGYSMSYNKKTLTPGTTNIDSLNFTGTGNLAVSGIKAVVLLNYGSIGNVRLSLVSPTGTVVNLTPPSNPANTSKDLITIFDPSADSTINYTNFGLAPFSPKVKPFENFNSLIGKKANGWWKLRITDASTGTMLRVLNGWGIKLETTVGIENDELPTKYFLAQNYPNPFNPSTTISYQLPTSSFVSLKIYDVLGNEVKTLVNEYKQAGDHNYELKIDNSELSSGIYFYRINAGYYSSTKKLVYIK